MGFSNEWEETYKARAHLSVWPWSDLVSLVMRYCQPENNDFWVLEVGCGPGANIPFFKSLGVNYFSIEGSPTIVEQLHKQYPELHETIAVGDFTAELPFEETFDLIVDRGSFTHNDDASIHRGIQLVCNSLKPDGKFVGVDWFSDRHSEYLKGSPAEDQYTRTAFSEGQMKGVGKAHFTPKEHLFNIFSDFTFLALEHKAVERCIPEDNWCSGTWNFVAQKKD